MKKITQAIILLSIIIISSACAFRQHEQRHEDQHQKETQISGISDPDQISEIITKAIYEN